MQGRHFFTAGKQTEAVARRTSASNSRLMDGTLDGLGAAWVERVQEVKLYKVQEKACSHLSLCYLLTLLRACVTTMDACPLLCFQPCSYSTKYGCYNPKYLKPSKLKAQLVSMRQAFKKHWAMSADGCLSFIQWLRNKHLGHFGAVQACGYAWIPFGDHPIKLERYRED